MDGKSPNLADNPPFLQVDPTPSDANPAIHLMLDLSTCTDTLPAHSPLIKQLQWMSVSVGENSEGLYVTGHLTTDNAEVAKQIKGAINGTIAMTLLSIDNPDTIALLKAVKVDNTDKNISTDQAWPHLEKAMNAIIEHHKGAVDKEAIECSKKRIEDAEKRLDAAKNRLETAKKRLDAAQKRLDDAKTRLEKKLQATAAGGDRANQKETDESVNETAKQLEEDAKQVEESVKQLEESK
jgi:hypothetical protein